MNNSCFATATTTFSLFVSYLQLTVTLTEAVALPTLLVAVHQYSPSCSLLMFFNGRKDPGYFLSLLPSFDHVTLGGGLPVALQESVTSLVSFSVWFLEISVMFGRTITF